MTDGLKLIGYSSDDQAYYRHGGEKTKRQRYYSKRKIKQSDLLKKNIKPGKFTCCYCGIPLDRSNYTRDHLIPVNRGGKTTHDNIKPCCYDCNQEKGNMMPSTYIEFVRGGDFDPEKLANCIRVLGEI